MEDILTQAGSNKAVADLVSQTIQKDKLQPSFRQMISSQLILDLWMCSLFYADANNRSAPSMCYTHDSMFWTPPESKARNAFLDAQEAYLITHMLTAIRLADASRDIRHVGFMALLSQHDPKYRFDQHWLSDLSYFDEDADRIDAQTQVALASASVMSHRATSGAYPDTLPSGFLDPYTGKSLGYRREGKGFVIYSVGRTGKFDGGKPGETVPGGDIVFRYPVPIQRAK